jgi:formylglycine-generating enzyme required for sulfatase activity
MKDKQIALVIGSLALIVVIIGILLYIGSDKEQEGRPPMKAERVAKQPRKVPETPTVPVQEEISEPEQPVQIEPIVEAPLPAPIASGKCTTESKASAKKRRRATPAGMVYVPGGAFVMGSPPNVGHDDESPAHEVCLNGFYIDTYEVTNARFKEFVEATGYVTDLEKDPASALGRSWHHPYGPNSSSADDMPDHPVVCVSWNDAQTYAAWAGKRLPTEAEWEKAARGTDARVYPWGNTAPTAELSNIADKSAGLKWSEASLDDTHKQAAPAGAFPAGTSAYGADDMGGNVWEWCRDWWASDYYANSPAKNPLGPQTGDFKVIRGGSWFYSSEGTRAAHRMYFRPEGAGAAIGFRCVKNAG